MQSLVNANMQNGFCIPMTIREKLTAAIERSGISLNALAKETGLQQTTIMRFVDGMDTRLSVIEKLADHFGFELEEKKHAPAKKSAPPKSRKK